MKVRGSMSGCFTSKMKIFFFLLIYRKHLPNLLFCKICLFFLSIWQEIQVNLPYNTAIR